MPAPPEQVHIAPPAPRHSARQHDARRLGMPADPLAAPAAVLDMPATLEYASGCQRSHSRVLAAAVRQPFSVHSAARELPSGSVAVQLTLTSHMAVPAQLARLALEPQPGLLLTSSLLDCMGLLPTTLPPFGCLTAAFMLAPDPAWAAAEHCLLPAKLQPSALVVDYSIDSRQQCGVAAAPLAGHAREAKAPVGAPVGGSPRSGAAVGAAVAAVPGQTPAGAVLDMLTASSDGGSQDRQAVMASPTAATAAAEALAEGEAGAAAGTCSGDGDRQQCCFRHLLSLERPASDEDTTGGQLSLPACSNCRWRPSPCPAVAFAFARACHNASS
jgi:hypothetical protein